jgi:adenylosuccinate lyase
MPYKQNPMRAERICALSRLLLHQRSMIAETAATQWLERSLDDSAARRVAIPDLFMTADGVLRVAIDLIGGLLINEPVVEARLSKEAPFLAVEKLLVRGVRRGGDRQELHEALRNHAVASRDEPDAGGVFRALVAGDPVFQTTEAEIAELTQPAALVGRAEAQIKSYLADVVDPLLAARSDVSDVSDPLTV